MRARWLTALRLGPPLLAALAAASCRDDGQPRLITVYVPDIAVSLPLPQGWHSAANQQGGFRMTTFTGPSVDVPERDGIQVQVMAGPALAGSSLREVADRFYIGEQTVLSERAFRLGADEGFLWTFAWERRPQSGRLLLIQIEDVLYGVFATGEARSVQAYGPTLDRMYEGFSIESAGYFDLYEDPAFHLALRYPKSWTRSHFLRQAEESLFVGFRSGPLAVDADGTTVHATLEGHGQQGRARHHPRGFLQRRRREPRRELPDAPSRHPRRRPRHRGALLRRDPACRLSRMGDLQPGGGDDRTYLYRFHCRNVLYRAIEPWLAEIAAGFARTS